MRTFISTLLILALAIGGYYGFRAADSQSAPPAAAAGGDKNKPAGGKPARSYPVRVQTIKVQPVHYKLNAIGSLEAQDVYQIYASVAGTLSDVTFNEGTEVKAGQVLAKTSSEMYQFAVDKQKAIYDQAVADVEIANVKSVSAIAEAKINLDEAKAQVARRQSVAVPGAVSPEEMLQFQTKAALAENSLKSATDLAEKTLKNLEAIKAEKLALWNAAQDDLRRSQIVAPIAGIIDSRKVTNGQYVTAGMPAAVLVDRRTLKLRFQVPEQECGAIHNGDTAVFKVPAWPTREFKAEVYFMSNQIDPASRVIDCYARVTQDLDKLKPGFFASVTVITGGTETGVVVPSTALLPTEKGIVAFVVKKDAAEKRFVKTGLSVTEDGIEILDGLFDGETLVIEGASALDTGFPVKVLAGEEAKAEFAINKTGAP
ncbi:MAG TPA: efflux RND transporter periplasmic adaptor subunit [Planctomycetota bacterium]|nr:efflux RND transporter periplasmic adaptor subunit [Planctomycetota bacterium]